MGDPRMDPLLVEDRALKKMLRQTDFGREVEIPRAAVKQFPSNVSNSNFRRSASARAPSRQNSFPGGATPNNNNYFPKSNVIYPFKTPPIDIATLLDPPARKTPVARGPIDIATLHDPPLASPKIPISRGLGRSYSNRNDSPSPLQAQRPASRMPEINGGGGSFLYSGNYNPNAPNGQRITNPVPLARSQSLNVKHAGPRPRPNKRNPRVNNKAGGLKNKNPLAGAAAGGAVDIKEEDEVDFDTWANDLYNDDNNNNSRAAVAGIAVAGKSGQKKGDKKQVSNKGQTSPQQNWVLAGGPGASENKASFRDDALDVAQEVALEQGQEVLTSLITGGGLNPTDIGAGLGGALGGKAGGKLGGAIGKKLGNEKLGEDIGEAVGSELGGIAGEVATDAAMDALGELGGEALGELGGEALGELGGEALGNLAGGIEAPEMPDASNLCSKCSVM